MNALYVKLFGDFGKRYLLPLDYPSSNIDGARYNIYLIAQMPHFVHKVRYRSLGILLFRCGFYEVFRWMGKYLSEAMGFISDYLDIFFVAGRGKWHCGALRILAERCRSLQILSDPCEEPGGSSSETRRKV